MDDIFEHIKMNYSVEHITKAIKAARKEKRMSQRALGAKTGVPQSHISRIENGAVDIKTSSLIEFARALDMELMLVPRILVPAIQGILRGAAKKSVSASGNVIENTAREFKKALKSVRQVARFLPKADELKRLTSTLRDMEQLRIPVSEFEKAMYLVKQIDEPLKAIKEIQQDQGTISGGQKILLEQLAQIDRSTRHLRYLRNAIVHGLSDQGSIPIPVYRLDKDEDDA